MTATVIIQPIDLIKVYKQLNPEKSYLNIFNNIYYTNDKKNFINFYKGIDIALIRQSVYGTIRLGMFLDLKDNYKINPLISSIISSSVATIINNPIDYWLINKQTNKNFSIISEIKQTGLLKILYKGLAYNLGRSVSINLGFGFKPLIENKLNTSNKNNKFVNQFLSIIISSISSTIIALPFDLLRTLSQKNIPFNYTHFNLKQLLISYPIFASRVLPHSIITMFCLDFYNIIYKKFIL